MPINKILISHKFGIISQTHKRLLQERLLKQRLEAEQLKKQKSSKNDDLINLQINEEFVKEYNDSSLDKKLKLNSQCSQIYEKIRKKLLTKNENFNDLNIQLCWAELSQLMQCNSPIQEDCMDLFINSILNTTLNNTQIPTLFFLAETIIYWIRTDTVNQPFLRAFEIKLLRLGKLIFERIYFHFKFEKSLNEHQDLIEHLKIYLHGFDELKTAYSPYPDAFLYIHFMIEIGKQITDNDQIKLNINNQFLTNTIELFNSLSNQKQLDSNLNQFLELSFELYQEQNWIDCSIGLNILAECSKTSVKCLNLFLAMSRKDENEMVLIKDEITPRFSQKGFEAWLFELQSVYVELLTEICITCTNQKIKQTALFGSHLNPGEIFVNKNKEFSILGLIDCARLNDQNESNWKIRYLAVKGLVKICKFYQNDRDSQEFRQTCWSCLVILQEEEKNLNVLEALKVGQALNSKIENLNIKIINNSIYSQIGVYSKNTNKKLNEEKKKLLKVNEPIDEDLKMVKSLKLEPMPRQKMRTTLKEEIIINNKYEYKVPSYYERKNFDLMRIVEDQYRKEENHKFNLNLNKN